MLVTDVGDEIALVTTINVGDGFGHFAHQYPLSFYISAGLQHSKDVTNIHKSSPVFNHHHHDVTNIKVSI